jgi:hypothetical protein
MDNKHKDKLIDGRKNCMNVKEAHSVSFENLYLVMFYGNQII